MTRPEYEALVAERKRALNPKPQPSEDSYGSHGVIDLDANDLYKDADGQWCCKR